MEAPIKKKYCLDRVFTTGETSREIQKADEIEKKIIEDNVAAANLQENGLLKLLVRFNREEAIEKLLKDYCIKSTFDDLQEAIARNHTDVALLLIKQNANLLQEQGDIGTPLHLASFYDNRTVAEELLKKSNIDVNARNKFDDTALHLAVRNGYEAMVSLLCQQNADPRIQSKRKFGRAFDPMAMAYRRLCNPSRYYVSSRMTGPMTTGQKYTLYSKIWGILCQQYVEKFGGKIYRYYV